MRTIERRESVFAMSMSKRDMTKTEFHYEYRGLLDWIFDLKEDLLLGDFKNRSKHQRKLISLEKALSNLKYRYRNHRKKGRIYTL
jgi:hypothetical protein